MVEYISCGDIIRGSCDRCIRYFIIVDLELIRLFGSIYFCSFVLFMWRIFLKRDYSFGDLNICFIDKRYIIQAHALGCTEIFFVYYYLKW